INIRQVHGDHVLIATAQDLQNQEATPEADGIVTNIPGVPIAVRTADCLPVFIFDPKKNCIGVAHAGWRGSEKQIAVKAVKLMKEYWACASEDLQIAFGPAIRSCCYEVGPEFKTFFPAEILERNNKLFLDLIAVNRNQLLRYGIEAENIFDSEVCTCCDAANFSYRREGKAAGRHISVIVLKPS
ncbi:MAG TPA: peptidoglycan editing factor PgeF, partial [Candidatus Omnitrophota bacterium]|nr:peptidoglycan editing factor PgeF [Candidatus Omnitrophota bacterium]